MIIIKIIILYFIQIRHTDDFPSTGTRLVLVIVGNKLLSISSHCCVLSRKVKRTTRFGLQTSPVCFTKNVIKRTNRSEIVKC